LPFSFAFEWDTNTLTMVPGTMEISQPFSLNYVSSVDFDWATSDWNNSGLVQPLGALSGMLLQLIPCNLGPSCGPSVNWTVPGSYPSSDIDLLGYIDDEGSTNWRLLYGGPNISLVVTAVPPIATPEGSTVWMLRLGLCALCFCGAFAKHRPKRLRDGVNQLRRPYFEGTSQLDDVD
jgi:hypothetical protein